MFHLSNATGSSVADVTAPSAAKQELWEHQLVVQTTFVEIVHGLAQLLVHTTFAHPLLTA